MNRRNFLFAAALPAGAFLAAHVHAAEPRPLAEQVAAGEKFLAGMFDPALDLLPEFPGASVYWLYHDNYLAAKRLDATRPDLAKRIRAAIASYGVTSSGKIEILYGEAKLPLPFRRYQLTDVKRIGDKLVRTEIVTDEPTKGWERYADQRFFAAIALAETDRTGAREQFDAGMAMWDGRGFDDPAAKHLNVYATYKLALALIAARRIGAAVPVRDALLARIASQQNAAGGWVTDYTRDGAPHGFANVETSCMVMLALEAAMAW
jgi:hypothetical protein